MKVPATLLLVVCLAANSLEAANTPSKFSKEHQATAELLQGRKWDEAATAYREILAKGPRDSLAPNAQYGLFLALDRARKSEAARSALQSLEQLVKDMKSEGKLSGQHPIEAWMFRVRSEAGRLHEEAGDFADAAKEHQKAAAEMGTRPQMADWRARAYVNAARCLQQAKQTDAAIELLRKHLPELNRAEFAGMRALQTAALAKLHADDGDDETAEKLVASLKADPQIDESQLAVAKELVAGRALDRTPTRERGNDNQGTSFLAHASSFKMRTRRGPDYLAIESIGRFEIRIALQEVGRNLFGDNRYGWINAWYNLEDDPFKTRNLCGLSYFPLIKPHHLTWLEKRDGEWKRINSQRYKEYNKTLDVFLGMQKGPSPHQQGNVKFEVLEDTPTRVRTKTIHDRWPFESMEYTFYPTGQIFVSAYFNVHHEKPDLRIGGVSFYTVKNAQINWRDSTDSTSRMPGEGGSQFNTTYVLSHSNIVPSFHMSMPDDILTCSSAPHDSRTFINNEIPLMWRRTPLRFAADRELKEKRFALQMRVYPRDIDSFEAGLPYVRDYQKPAKVSVQGGTLVTDSVGDLNGDGYDESHGCFVIKADQGEVKATLDATQRSCFQPVLKIVGWTGGKPQTVSIDGRPAGERVNVSVVEDSLLVQLLSTLTNETTVVEVKLETRP